jgi:hypothetical protein
MWVFLQSLYFVGLAQQIWQNAGATSTKRQCSFATQWRKKVEESGIHA